MVEGKAFDSVTLDDSPVVWGVGVNDRSLLRWTDKLFERLDDAVLFASLFARNLFVVETRKRRQRLADGIAAESVRLSQLPARTDRLFGAPGIPYWWILTSDGYDIEIFVSEAPDWVRQDARKASNIITSLGSPTRREEPNIIASTPKGQYIFQSREAYQAALELLEDYP